MHAAFDLVYYTALLEMAPVSAICFYNRELYRYNVWEHCEDFREKDLTAAGVKDSNRRMCQTEIDRWFKSQPKLSKLPVTVENTYSEECFISKRIIRPNSNYVTTYLYLFSNQSHDKLRQLLSHCVAPVPPSC